MKVDEVTVEAIYRFAGDRCLTDRVSEILNENKVNLNGVSIYRGFPYPFPLLRKGEVIQEWNGSSHWSLDKSVAELFSMDYINEDYSEEMQEIFGMSEEELFVPVIMKLESPHDVVELYKFFDSPYYTHGEQFKAEKEITIVGYDFMINDVVRKDNAYEVNVTQLPHEMVKNKEKLEQQLDGFMQKSIEHNKTLDIKNIQKTDLEL